MPQRWALCLIPALLASCAAGFRPGEVSAVDEDQEDSDPVAAIDGLVAQPGTGLPAGARRENLEDSTALSRYLDGDQRLRELRLEEAAEAFSEAVRKAGPGESWRYEPALADAYLGLHREKEAEEIYRRLLRVPAFVRTAALRSNLAVACLRQGNPAAARAAVEEALTLDPGAVEAHKTLGLIDLAEGKTAQALARLEAAVEREPHLPEAQLALARAAEAAGRPAEALRRYQLLLDQLPARLPLDTHRRYRDLFYPSPRPVAVELRERLEALRPLAASPLRKEDS